MKKFKAPNTKEAPRQRASDRFWNLNFGISLELGVWDLVFRSGCGPLPRRERPVLRSSFATEGGRAYPSAVCEERATPAAAKKTATRRAAPDLTGRFVAPQSQSTGGYAPSSRLATVKSDEAHV